MRPNPSLNRTRYGKHRKPGLRHMVHHLSPGLRCLPPRARLARTLGRTPTSPRRTCVLRLLQRTAVRFGQVWNNLRQTYATLKSNTEGDDCSATREAPDDSKIPGGVSSSRRCQATGGPARFKCVWRSTCARHLVRAKPMPKESLVIRGRSAAGGSHLVHSWQCVHYAQRPE
jgi:hypothetical protein